MTSAHQPLSGLGSGHTIRSRSSSSATGASGFSITMTFLCAGARCRTHTCGEPSCSCAPGGFAPERVESAEHRAARVPRPIYRNDRAVAPIPSTFTTAHLKQTDLYGSRFGHQTVAWLQFNPLISENTRSTGFLTRNRKSAASEKSPIPLTDGRGCARGAAGTDVAAPPHLRALGAADRSRRQRVTRNHACCDSERLPNGPAGSISCGDHRRRRRSGAARTRQRPRKGRKSLARNVCGRHQEGAARGSVVADSARCARVPDDYGSPNRS